VAVVTRLVSVVAVAVGGIMAIAWADRAVFDIVVADAGCCSVVVVAAVVVAVVVVGVERLVPIVDTLDPFVLTDTVPMPHTEPIVLHRVWTMVVACCWKVPKAKNCPGGGDYRAEQWTRTPSTRSES
jgi:hypothetical protein